MALKEQRYDTEGDGEGGASLRSYGKLVLSSPNGPSFAHLTSASVMKNVSEAISKKKEEETYGFGQFQQIRSVVADRDGRNLSEHVQHHVAVNVLQEIALGSSVICPTAREQATTKKKTPASAIGIVGVA